MDRRRLGKTGFHVSTIGFGAFKIGRNEGIKYAHGYDLPSEEEAGRLLNGVLDLGVNYIDTAPAYGLSEQRLGKLIAHRRGEFVLSTKVGEHFAAGRSTYDFSRDAVRTSVERSLRNLRTDVLDLVFVHAHADDAAILDGTDVVETLTGLRTAGLVRCIGFSGKTVAAARRALEWADALMIEFHARDTSHETLLRECAKADAGVVVKKGLASGRLPPEQAIPFVLGRSAVATLVVGSLNLDHIRSNLQIAAGVRPRVADDA